MWCDIWCNGKLGQRYSDLLLYTMSTRNRASCMPVYQQRTPVTTRQRCSDFFRALHIPWSVVFVLKPRPGRELPFCARSTSSMNRCSFPPTPLIKLASKRYIVNIKRSSCCATVFMHTWCFDWPRDVQQCHRTINYTQHREVSCDALLLGPFLETGLEGSEFEVILWLGRAAPSFPPSPEPLFCLFFKTRESQQRHDCTPRQQSSLA